MSDEIDQVHPQLWIASICGARTHGMDEFDAVITTCQDEIRDHVPDDVAYRFFNMSDGEAGMYGGKSNYDFFHTVASTILRRLESGDEILVHCHQGQSRSASTSIAALSVYEGVPYHEMHDRIEEERPQIHPDGLLEDHAIRLIEEETDIDHTPFRD